MANVKKTTLKNSTLKLCITAMFAALLIGGKEALASIPNVEVVTLLIAVCAYVWGLSVSIPAVFAFIAVDMCIWGFGTWVISYAIHWNVVAVCFWLFSKGKMQNVMRVVFATLFAVVLTGFFGVLTSAIDTVIAFYSGKFVVNFYDFLTRFAALYANGIAFYVTQIICNAVLFPVAFLPLVLLNQKMKRRMFDNAVDEAQTDETQTTDANKQ